ncbi:MAG: twin-arginine translocase TatA/TatE family subunit [Planctomycetota bacterium]
MPLPLAFFEFISIQGFLILAILGVLLYGERLPEVAASLGKQLMHLKKSVQGIRDEIESVAFDTKHAVARSMEKADDFANEESTAPKFEPPPAEPAVMGSAAEFHASPGGPSSDKT